MQFSKFSLLSLTIGFTNVVMGSPLATPAEVDTVEARGWYDEPCILNAQYCGWYLQGVGYQDLNANEIYVCRKPPYTIALVSVCQNGCAGPTAHCN